MADLEDLGLIAAPHTSAGRQPTQQGLRFFVDAMLEVGAVDERERNQIARQIEGQSQGGKLEDFLTEASSLLSGLSHGAGVVIAAKVRHGAASTSNSCGSTPTQGMAILVGQDGTVENRIVPLPPGLTARALTQASNYLASLAVGKTIAEVARRRPRAARRARRRTRRTDAEAGRCRPRDALASGTPRRRRR